MIVLLATSNEGKLEEFKRFLSDSKLEVIGLTKLQRQNPVPETGSSYAENALGKARAYHEGAGLVTVADDSGLEVDALGGEPGLRSARYASTDRERIEKLLHAMNGIPEPERTARFICVAAVVSAHGERIFHGEVRGRILTRPRGRGGFGFDPVFYFEPLKKTFAEMTAEEKDRVSHRGAAFRQVTQWFAEDAIA
jgi:XTP/dITP diphosphohydrolase